MHCPNPQCQSIRLRRRNTYSTPDNIGIPAEFKIINMTRRARSCMGCGSVFYTIEIPEADYRKLINQVGRLDAGQPRVRPL